MAKSPQPKKRIPKSIEESKQESTSPAAIPHSEHPDPTRHRTILLILGMHRSGTSAMTNTFALLGATLPTRLMPAGPFNSLGHFEPLAIVDEHDRMLAELGESWFGSKALDKEFFKSDLAGAYARRICKMVEEEYGNAGLMVVKDPRICRFVPLWRAIAEQLGVGLKVVIPFRNPLEVAQSIAHRDNLPIDESLAVWTRHVLEAEAATRDLPRAFIVYEEFLNDWQSVVAQASKRAGIHFPRRKAETRLQIDKFLNSGLRKQVASEAEFFAHSIIPQTAKDVYWALKELKEHPDFPPVLKMLDYLKADLDRMQVAAEANARSEELSEKLSETERRFRLCSAEVEDLRDDMSARQQELSRVLAHFETERAVLNEQIGQAHLQVHEGQVEADNLRASLAAKENEYSRTLADTLANTEAERFALHKQLDEADRQLLQWKKQAEALKGALETETKKSVAQGQDLSAAQAAIAVLRPRLSEAEREITERNFEIETLRFTFTGANNRIQILEQQIAQSDKDYLELKRRTARSEIEIEVCAEEKHTLRELLSAEAEVSRKTKQKCDLLVQELGLADERLAASQQSAAERGVEIDEMEGANETLTAELHQTRSELRTVEDERQIALGALIDKEAALAQIKKTRVGIPDALASLNRPRPTIRKVVAMLRRTGMVRQDWYRQNYPDVIQSGFDPVEHYVRIGFRNGYFPHPLFDTRWYLTRYEDVLLSGQNPFLHFLLHGRAERRCPNAFFDIAWYIDTYADVTEAGKDPFLHFDERGTPEARDPSPAFSTSWYLDEYPDVAASGMNALVHFLHFGRAEGRRPLP